jgi:hypothetical protein
MLRQSSVRYLNEVSVGVSIPLWNREVAAAGSDAQFIGERAATRGRPAAERLGERGARLRRRATMRRSSPIASQHAGGAQRNVAVSERRDQGCARSSMTPSHLEGTVAWRRRKQDNVVDEKSLSFRCSPRELLL